MMVIGGSGISPGGDWVVVDDIASDLALGRCHFRLVYRSREMRRRWSVDVDVESRTVKRSVRPGKGSKREKEVLEAGTTGLLEQSTENDR